jgi:uncharacterized membrane protein
MSKAYKPVSKYISSKSIFFPIGMVLITVTNINPTNWCQGTWESFGQGRTLVGVDTGQTEFNTVNKTGGEKSHILTIAEMPIHGHSMLIPFGNSGGGVTGIYGLWWNGSSGSGSIGTIQSPPSSGEIRIGVNANGGGQAHNNLQPYITVYFWRKTSN